MMSLCPCGLVFLAQAIVIIRDNILSMKISVYAYFLHVQRVDDIGKPAQLFRKFLTQPFRIIVFPCVKEIVRGLYRNVHFSVRKERHIDRATALVHPGRNPQQCGDNQ